jgi:glutamine cyclotransferase
MYGKGPMRTSGITAGLLLVGALACSGGEPAGEATVSPSPSPAVARPEELSLHLVHTYPHDPGAFTQGLLWHQGYLYESTGQYGASELRKVELATGRVVESRQLPSDLFGEGLALVGEELFQLTWRSGVLVRWSLGSFEPLGEVRYAGEGWGLCWDGERLVMSDGTARLAFRDPGSFRVTGEVQVEAAGEPLQSLNELEWVDGAIWANVWRRDELVRIDPGSGRVTGRVDASGLLTPEERLAADVLNGIAFRRESGTFLLTGKYWPKLFEVRLVGGGAAATGS